ncbi:MAG: coproporphyrinogen III oxidase [Nitrospira bacterium HGW-Nitrospira-1]|nr:MAG: coproporphyrinogen III oxidase [Nitrospira bacterium HGW-Nitrospira-1]
MAEFLYIHIPYCIRKCIYCDFLSISFDEQAARRYVKSLCRELEIKRDSADILSAIFIGGGTPTLLPEDCFKQLFCCLRENYDFSPEIEISVEANPGTVNASKIEALHFYGVNRMSIGIQSFHDDELKTLGRVHTVDEALLAIDLLKKSGNKNFAIDLMYGIPGQTMEGWKETLSKAAGLLPAHISSYELTPEDGTPLASLIKDKTIIMPEEGLVLEMYDHAINFLTGRGYEHYEISNFALPGYRCLHNLNYWHRGDYIGAGAGAHSFMHGVRSQNTSDINTYIDSLTNDIITEAEAIGVSDVEALKEFIFLGLRKIEGIALEEAMKMRPDFMELCAELIDSGHLAISANQLRLTRKGLPVSNMVIVQLFERLGL